MGALQKNHVNAPTAFGRRGTMGPLPTPPGPSMRLALLLLLAAFAVPAAAQAVFVNEIHYDNAGTDTGEAVEIAGPAGASLDGWTLVLYNGNGGAPYDTVELGGTIPNERDDAGAVTVGFGTNGVQNGSPDGLALVDNRGDVVQFLSYEGTFEADGGPADGLTSTDIGVEEASSTPVGQSLQLVGEGTDYADFTWTGPTTASFGLLNDGQVLTGDGGGGGGGAEPRLVVNEVDYDQAGTDTAEFVELYNGGTATASLGAYELVFVNGSDGEVYETVALPAQALLPGEFFVVCANAETVRNCDLDDGRDTNFIQNGSPDAVALRLAGGGAVVDALSYEGEVEGFTEGSGAGADDVGVDFAGLSRLPDGADTDDNAADFALRCGTPGVANTADDADCASTAPGVVVVTRISAVQGGGAASPLDGQVVTVEAVVVGDFQPGDGDDADLGGFYIQEEAADTDGDDATSEGLFVDTEGASVSVPDVVPGDVVRVTGTAGEAFGQTQIGTVTAVEAVGTADLPDAVEVTLPLASETALERVEGMRVVLPQALAVSDYFNFDRFNEVVLGLPRPDRDRLFQPTAYLDPSSPEAAQVEAENDLRTITLDDARTSQNPDPLRHPNGQPFTLDNRFRGGDLVQNAVGVVGFSFGRYRLQPTGPADFTVANPRPEAPESVGGTTRVATFNVLNYFNGDGEGGGFPTARGADNPEELERQTAKLVAAIRGLDAAVIGVIEVENDEAGELSALDDLVDALNEAAGEGAYDYVETGVTGTDEIKSALIYRPALVTPVGGVAVLDDPAFTDPFGSGGQRNRPAVAQTFSDANGTFTVVVNHFKSKGGSCGPGDDDPLQGSCNGTRTAAAEALLDWLAGDPTGSGDADVLLVGDFNAYDEEDLIDAVRAGADGELGTADDYVDLVERDGGEFAYSYLFGAELGYLDYAFASPSLAGQVTGTTVWHINADEPDLLDYDTDFNDPAFYEPNAYRSSDHDPVLVGLALGGDAVATACSVDSPLGFGDFDADGDDPTFGEFAELLSGADGPVDLSTCALVAFDPFTERVTFSTSPDVDVDGRLVYATQGGDVDLPAGVLPDGPGALALVEGGAAVGAPVSSVAGRVVAAVVYVDEDRVFGRRGYSPGARTAGAADDLAAMLAAVRADLPTEVELALAGANPVGQGGAVAFALPQAGPVAVSVFDLLGREVSRLVDASLPAGRHRAALDAGALPSGVYVVRLVAGGEVRTTRVTVAR